MLKRNIRWDRDKICEEIRILKDNGASLAPAAVRRVNPRLFNAAVRKKHFGHWKNALEQCGLNPDEEYRNGRKGRKQSETWTSEEIIEALQSKSPGELSLVYKEDPRFYAAARRLFGSWKGALRAAGCGEAVSRLKDEKLLDAVRHYLENPLRTAVYKDDPTLYARAYRRYGSWKRAVEEALREDPR
ncbi:MAG TPA: hypothetical protein PLF44_00820 [Candidatus Mcinerneyibacteriales bacterium]|nr:hypothetical protein [Candidatus Mcinerneyibacteriales bacterium]HPE20421.1 hypothetical protein [Candidatus Mcinerneyibacteriales bacterium]HPJ69400.1 hypothetical protein [Candidatus Mcinerneyibacteriales bacterium]HPQ88685.1 hypothetical protein [Candidatus Mcinerneyibacteriales bacterium]